MARRIMGIIAWMMIVTAIHAGDNIQFLYQTRVFLNNSPASGTVDMKFAIVDGAGNTLWNNDGSTGAEPTDAVSLTARNGVVSVEIGDASLTNMTALHNIILHRRDGAQLRVWLDDTISGFQQFTPDTGINPNFLYMPEVTEDLTLYVDGSTGDNANTGLDPSTALQTIQAAVDKVPKIIRDDVDVVIDIADGTYRELVTISGIRTGHNSRLTLIGDETTTPGTASAPSVRITASDDDVNRHRENCMLIRDSNTIGLFGIQFDFSQVQGVLAADHSRVYADGCRFTNNGGQFNFGLAIRYSSYGAARYCRFDNNPYGGAAASNQSQLAIDDCIFSSNPGTGLQAAYNCLLVTGNTVTFTNNGYAILSLENSIYENYGTVSISGSTYNDMRVRLFACARNTVTGVFPGSNILVETGSFIEGF